MHTLSDTLTVGMSSNDEAEIHHTFERDQA